MRAAHSALPDAASGPMAVATSNATAPSGPTTTRIDDPNAA